MRQKNSPQAATHTAYLDGCTRVLAAAVLCATAFGTVNAAEPPPVVFEAQPISHVREGRVQGCGIRLTGGQPATPVSSWFDVSFNVFRRGVGLVQSIAYEIKRSEYDGESRPATVPVQSTWLRAGDAGARTGENTERRDTLVYRMLADDVLALFEAVARGRPLTLGIRRWGERVDALYTVTPLLNVDSRERVSSCIAALTAD